MKKNLSFIRVAFIVLLIVLIISAIWHVGKNDNLRNEAEVATKIPLVTTANEVSFLPKTETRTWMISNSNTDTIVFSQRYCTDVYLNKSADAQNVSWLSGCNGVCLFVAAVLLVIAFVNLYNFLNAVTRGTFFTQENIKRLKKAGILFIVLSFLAYLGMYLSFLQNEKLMERFHFKVLNNATFDFGSFIIGLLLLAISYAFKKGIELQQEQDLTI